MPEIASFHPRLTAGSQLAPNPLTVIARNGGYDLTITTSASWHGFSVMSCYLGSALVGYHGTHLILGCAGHRFADGTQLEHTGPTTWPRRALLDHDAVLQEQLAAATGDTVRVDLTDAQFEDAET